MLHAPGESGTRSLLHLKFSSEAWHQWVGVLKLVRNREWYGGEICWSSYPMLVVKVKKLELAACEYCRGLSFASQMYSSLPKRTEDPTTDVVEIFFIILRNHFRRSDLSSILVEFWGTHHEHDGPVHKEYMIH
ncbi:unnamed protein product [Sphagnum jensenii]|uniref:Uncharacterized protein n=1 Tax=Sphagnum jensenii TaxID=128206 RepID=A0ABP0X8H2_9BRYO